MTRAPHCSDAMLLVLVRRPDPAASGPTARHLERCGRCRVTLTDLKTLRAHLRVLPAEPAAGVLARACALMEPRPPRRGEASQFKLATLLYDSDARARARVAGVRAPGIARQQLWRIPGADVDIRFEPPGLGAPGLLGGQVFPRRRPTGASPRGKVWLIQRGRRPEGVSLDESGEFELPAPQHRGWSLWLEWGELRARLVPR